MELIMTKIPTDLGRGLNKNISAICPFSLGRNAAQNHCAHYVSHMMGYEFTGPTCKNFTLADKSLPAKGDTIRVDDIFKNSTEIGVLSTKPSNLDECLVFVTLSSNVKKFGVSLVMGNNPKKHIGILSQGRVWNYSNTNKKVVCDLLPAFITKFANAYKTPGTTVEFYYGRFI
jgi:hypothetical protein